LEVEVVEPTLQIAKALVAGQAAVLEGLRAVPLEGLEPRVKATAALAVETERLCGKAVAVAVLVLLLLDQRQ
jgi:hypothetical protein